MISSCVHSLQDLGSKCQFRNEYSCLARKGESVQRISSVKPHYSAVFKNLKLVCLFILLEIERLNLES